MAEDAPKKSWIRETFEKEFVDRTSATVTTWFLIALLPMLIFSYGAAKLNYSINQSMFWSIVAFWFSGLYYPYYAFFQAPTGIISSAAAAVGARRRR